MSALLAQKPEIQSGGVQNAASLAIQDQPTIAPQMIVTIWGKYLAASTAAAAGTPLLTTLAGTTVTFNGIPAPLFYVSPSQINAQVPTALTGTTANILVTTAAGSSDAAIVQVASDAYGIFTQDGSGCGPGVVFNVHADGSVSMNGPQNSFDPSQDLALTLYMTGFGFFRDRQDGIPWVYVPADNVAANNYASLGVPGIERDTPLKVTYAGPAPARVGVDQVNLASFSWAAPPEGCAVPLYMTDNFNSSASQLVNVSIHTGGGVCSDPSPDSLGLITWQKNLITGSGSSSSTEGVQVLFRKGSGLVQPVAQTPGGWECCRPDVQPALACAASLPATVGAGTLTVSGATASPVNVAPQTASTGVVYQVDFPPGTMRGGAYQVSGGGDSAVGTFAAAADVPPPVAIVTNLSPGTALTLPTELTWTGGDSRSILEVQFWIVQASAPANEAFELKQWVDASKGTLELPAAIFFPGGWGWADPVPSGAVEIVVIQSPAASSSLSFTAPGLTLGGAQTWNYVWDFRGLKH